MPGVSEPGTICTARDCGVVNPFEATNNQGVGPVCCWTVVENVTGVAGSVLLREIAWAMLEPPCATVNTPNPSGSPMTNSDVVLMSTVTGIARFVGPAPEL